MTDRVAVVDLFSGPGGLAEGFAAFRDSLGRPRFNIVLSIEMDPTAHRTLLLRGFLRKFRAGFPAEYYDFLNGVVSREPDWASLYPREWQEAHDETRCLALGTSDASSLRRQPRIEGGVSTGEPVLRYAPAGAGATQDDERAGTPGGAAQKGNRAAPTHESQPGTAGIGKPPA